MSTPLFVFVNIAAGIFQGIVGFGQGLVATPLSLTFLPKEVALSGMIVAGVILNAFLRIKVSEPLHREIFKPLLISTLIGMPFGVVILRLVPLTALKTTVGALSIVLTAAIVFARSQARARPRLVPFVGFAAGLLQTSTSMPGPIVVLLLTSSGLAKDQMRKLLVTYFLITSAVSLPLYFLGRVLSWQGVAYGLLATPFIIGAGLVGNRIAGHVPHRWYRTLALTTVALTGAYAIYSGLQHYLYVR